MRYVSLHTHSTFSYGDGYGTVEEHVARVAELGMTAVALTEHGNVSSHVQLEKACEKHGIKPLYGCELYEAPTDTTAERIDGLLPTIKTRKKCHQTVLAIDARGYQNLNRLVSESWTPDHRFQWPTVSAGLLERFSEGLVVTSGCADGIVACTLLGGKEFGDKRTRVTKDSLANAVRVVERYQEIFGDRFYLEAQRFPGLERTCNINPALARISKITGARLVATSDVHYPLPEHNAMQRILHASHRGGTVESADASWEYDILLTYPTSDREILNDLIGTGLTSAEARDAILATEDIAQMATVVLPKNEPIKWPYDKSKYDSVEDYTWERLRQGWKFRWAKNARMRENAEQYSARVKYEMERIVPRGYCDYFGMLSYLVTWAKDHKIAVGPARGSAAASLVCYLLRITEVDPLAFPTMVFERFIDPDRLDLPDVDLDFADDRREEVVAEAVRVFGADRVCNIANFIRYRGKNSIDDIARVYSIPKWKAEQVKDLIIERSSGDSRISDSLQDTFDMFPAAQAVLDEYPELKYAISLEGNYRGLGVHAAGIVISNRPITDTCAVYYRDIGGRPTRVMPYDKKDAAYIGMLKADFLGLKTMGAIGIALELTGIDLEDLYSVPITDRMVLEAFKENDVTGIFQFDGRATKLVCRDVSPDNFLHLADINALSRPGPLFSGMTAQYVEVKHGRAKAEHLHPIVDEFTRHSYGQIVYQEQVLGVIRDLGGFPVQRVGDIRKIISQKLGEAQFNNMYEEFERGCWKLHRVDKAKAAHIWKFLVTSATYSFNIAHCVSYSLLAFWLMWLKVNEPVAFYAAQLEKVGDDKAQEVKRARLMRDALKHKVEIKPPHFQISGASWTADREGRSVLAGFRQVKGIGPAKSKAILDYRAALKAVNGVGFSDWGDLLGTKGIGPATMEKIKNFAGDGDPFGLELAGRILDELRSEIKHGTTGLPRPSHRSWEIPQRGEHRVVWMGIVRTREYKDYIEDQRARTGDSVDEIRAKMKKPHLVKSCVLHCYDDGDDEVYVRFNRYNFPKFKSQIEKLVPDEDIIIVTGIKKGGFGISLQVEGMITISPDDEVEEQDESDIADAS